MTLIEDLEVYSGDEFLEMFCENYNCCHEDEMSIEEYIDEVSKYVKKHIKEYYKKYLDSFED